MIPRARRHRASAAFFQSKESRAQRKEIRTLLGSFSPSYRRSGSLPHCGHAPTHLLWRHKRTAYWTLHNVLRRHLANDVPKLEPAIAALRADGIEPDPIIDLGDVIPGFRIVFFRDREGNILELMEGYRDEERDQR